MKYFIPEWDDRVDPKYDFITDTHSKMHEIDPMKNDVYMWDIFGLERVPFDGVLISKMKIMQNKKKYQLIMDKGVHQFLRLPESFEIMGDCGAWGYIKDGEPPFKTNEIVDYYATCGFNYGVSIDHLIVPMVFRNNPEEKQKRWKITIENAREFLDIWTSKDKYIQSFRPIGVAQGWDIESYRRAVVELLNMGYDYIGLGGLAKAQTGKLESKSESKLLLPVLQGVWLDLKKYMDKTKKKIDLHVFGVARPNHFQTMSSLGVTSFDSASPLRRAWIGATGNYFSIEGKSYSAIRIPQTDRSPKAKEIIRGGKATLEQIQALERQCLKLMRNYDKELVDMDTVLKSVLEYDRFIGEGREQFEEYFRQTLKDKPWKMCPCVICKNIGIEVIVFRGNNRNRRRGFHNTYVFYNVLKNPQLWSKFIKKRENEKRIELLDFKKDQKVLVITGCTKEKLGCNSSVKAPAKQMYQGRLFKTVRKYCETMGFDYVVISAKYGLIRPEETIEGYEKVLRTKGDVERIRPVVEERLPPLLKNYDKIVVIAGKQYREVLKNLWDETFVAVKSRGYGDLCSIVKRAIPKERTLLDFK